MIPLRQPIRRMRQLAADPVLRRWVVARALGRAQAEPPYRRHHPPYLNDRLPLPREAPPAPPYPSLATGKSMAELVLELPGQRLRVAADTAETAFTTPFDDLEAKLALHRFAWVPLAGDAVDLAWVDALWRIWLDQFGKNDDPWVWHPYTASERAINILHFAARYGLPGDPDKTLFCLTDHAPAIARCLEYNGDHHTSNHLANNGRGLFLLGLVLGLTKATDMGEAILLAEAERLIRPSGIVREGSSHYHLLVTRNYLDAWLAARKHGRRSAPALERIAHRLLAAARVFETPSGFAMIGDISPDCPPAYLTPVLSGKDQGWVANLSGPGRKCFHALHEKVRSTPPVPTKALLKDGWLAAQSDGWHGVWHASPDGWSHMPGHGHQDIGSFELHHGTEAIFIDPGRGAYGETGEAALYRSAAMHNGLTLDGADPYPPNRPYYDETFRRAVAGPAPKLRKTENGASLQHHGFMRLPGVASHTRHWRFDARAVTITDEIDSRSNLSLTRTLITPLSVSRENNGIRLQGTGRYEVTWPEPDVVLDISPVTRWTAYGVGVPATALKLTSHIDSAATVEFTIARIREPV